MRLRPLVYQEAGLNCMTKTSNDRPLSKHQKRVIAALFALEQVHGTRWWNRHAIGYVVAAGGYHDVIQIKTIAVLKEVGLVQTERSSWTEDVQSLVRCNCASYQWGLTDAGLGVARDLQLSWTEEFQKRVHEAKTYNWQGCQRDEDEPPPGFFDDDDDGDPFSPSPKRPDLLTA